MDEIKKEIAGLRKELHDFMKKSQLNEAVLLKIHSTIVPPGDSKWPGSLRFYREEGILQLGETKAYFASYSNECAILSLLFHKSGKAKKRKWAFDELSEELEQKRRSLNPKQVRQALKRIRDKTKEVYERDDIFVINSEKVFIKNSFTIL